MSIQSTIYINREQAEWLAYDQYMEKNSRKIKSKFVAMENAELEGYIEKTFNNYIIE